MVELSTDEAVQAAAYAGVEDVEHVMTLAARIAGTWEAQVGDERKQHEASLQHAQRIK